jgi:hypothetical protein
MRLETRRGAGKFRERNNQCRSVVERSVSIIRLSVTAAAVIALSLAASGPSRAAAPDPVAQLIEQSGSAIGAAALEHIQTLKISSKVVTGGLPGTSINWQQLGGVRFAESLDAPPISGSDGYDGTDFWNADNTGLVVVDGSEGGRAGEITSGFVGNYALWSPNRGGATVTWGGSKTDGGKTYDALEIRVPGSAIPFEMWFDRTTHLPERQVQTFGPQSATVTFSDYRATNGLMVPYAVHAATNDGNSSDLTVGDVVANPADAASHFDKPTTSPTDFTMVGGKTSTTVPINVAENHVYLPVMLNGKGPYRFIFDTGAVNIVDPAVAKEIGALGHGSVHGSGVGAATESVSFATVSKLQVGDALLRDQVFGIAPTRMGFGVSAGQPVDGLIGFEVLARFVTTFDYANNVVVLQSRKDFVPAADGDQVPFVFNGKTPEFPCTIDSIASKCQLDTGSRATLTLYGPFMAANPQIVPQTITANGVNGFGFGGPSLGRLGRLASFGVGKFTFSDLIGDFTTQEKGAFASPFIGANVGGGLWKRFALTLDYGKQLIALVPNASLQTRDAYERAGLFLINRGGQVIVYDARPGTPAAKAGVIKGDVIDTVNGMPAKSMSLQDIRGAFFGAPGTVVNLGLIGKDGSHRTVTITLNDYV